jgi:signal transduction histidine kinase
MPEASAEVRAAYNRHEQEIGLQRLRLGCWIAMALTPPGGLIDFLYLRNLPKPEMMLDPARPAAMTFQEDVLSFLMVRLACSAAILPILYLSGQPFGARHFRSLGVLLAFAPAFCMAWIIFSTTGADSPYYAGMTMVLLGVGMVMQWTVMQSLAASVMIVALYLWAVLMHPAWSAPGQSAILVTHLWFMLLTALIVVIGSHVTTRLRWSDFVARYNLGQSRNELAQTNDRLGDANHQLEESNRRLRELDELKGRFFANISHELRTPLTLLLGPLDHLVKHPAITRDDRLREYVLTMRDNGLRLLKLINDLLDLVRLDAGRLQLQKRRVEVAGLVAGLIQSVRAYAEDRGLRVSVNTSPELRYVVADADKMGKVLLNLLFNSIKFTPAGGQVTLTTAREGDEAVIEVTDTGMGIAPENLSNLFQRFWQADNSAHRKFQGAGIGLALVKELVVAHGGQVSARSEVGKGTTMSVRLPVGPVEQTPALEPDEDLVVGGGTGVVAERAGADGSPANTPPAVGFEARRHLASLYKRAEMHASITPLRSSLRPWDAGRGGNRPELLVVDDEPDMLRFLKSQLEDDYLVREAVDGNQATSMAAQYLPDAVVCDMMLPEKDGLEVCRELRQNHTTRSLPFLMLTARADDETKLSALAAGASDYLPKPFSTAELKLRLKNLVDAQRLQKELSRQNRKLESTLVELKDTETQLFQAEKMASLGRLSAGIIHEINNPLNFARTGLHVLTRIGRMLPEEGAREEFQEVLADIGEGITRVSTIVGDLRQFSHPQGDALGEVDVQTTVDAALRFLSADWRDGRVDVSVEIPDDFQVRANRNKLVQVLLNLCQNALDAMRDKPPEDGRKPGLSIRAWKENGRKKVAVRDNGPGIPANHLTHIFDPFYTTKDVGKGMGLGLSICYRIIEEVGGRITVNTEVGRFCEFVLDFPDRSDDKQPQAQAVTEPSAQA